MSSYQSYFCYSGADVKPYYVGTGLAGQISVAVAGSPGIFVWDNTMGGSSSVVYAATGNSYIVTDLATDLVGEFRLVQSGNSITIDTTGNLIIINAVTNAGGSTNTASLVQSSRTISTIYPISGGGDLSVDRTHAIDTAFLINSGRTISAGMGLVGGGDLSADRTFVANTALLVTTGVSISTVYPISGGGNLSLSRTFAIDTSFLINTGRTISTVYPISGGGNLSLSRTFAVDTAFFVNTGRTLSTGDGLTGGGDLSANRTISSIDRNIESFRPLNTTPVPVLTNRGFIAGAYDCTAMATQSVEANTMKLIPFFVKNSMTISNAYLNITSAGVGSKFRLFIYDNSSLGVSYPFKAIYSSGYLAGSAIAVVSASIVKTLSSNSIYWVGILVQATNVLQFRSVPLNNIYPFFGVDTAMGTAYGWGIGSGYTATTNVPPSFDVGGVVLTDVAVPAILLIGSL